jgi:hypothetical protein
MADKEVEEALRALNDADRAKTQHALAGQLAVIDDAVRQQAEAPVCAARNGILTYTYHAFNIKIELGRLKESSRGQFADLTASTIAPVRLLTQGQLNLSSVRVRQDFVRRLASSVPGLEWAAILEQVCAGALAVLHEHAPAVWLCGATLPSVDPFVLNPLLYAGHPTLLYGPGDSAKSLLACYCGLLLSKGGAAHGLSCSAKAVLYLDWELQAEDVDRRVAMLTAGNPELRPGTFAYAPMCRPLSDVVEYVTGLIAETGADVLIVDSVGLAAGAELEKAETAIRFFQALKLLKRPALLIGHTAKSQDEDKRTPFGSVYFFNLSRTIWEVKKVQEPGTSTSLIGLYSKKNNLGPPHPALGFSFRFQEQSCFVGTANLSTEPVLEKKLSVGERIAGLLADREPRTPKAICEATGLPEGSVRSALLRGLDRLWIKIDDFYTLKSSNST